MHQFFERLPLSLRWIDFLDISIVAFIIYRLLLLIKGTRAMQMVIGLLLLGVGFYLSSVFELFTTHWVFSYLADYLILIVVVLFQDDWRRALTHVGKNPFSSTGSIEKQIEIIEHLASAAARLGKNRIGALIVIEQETGLRNFIDNGTRLDACVSAELLYTLFLPNSRLHDGAAILSGGRIAAVGCFLPLSNDASIDKFYGARHRAALGLTEETDAVVVLVSEEAGTVHLVKNGKITTSLSQQELMQSLNALLEITRGQLFTPRKIKVWLDFFQSKG